MKIPYFRTVRVRIEFSLLYGSISITNAKLRGFFKVIFGANPDSFADLEQIQVLHPGTRATKVAAAVFLVGQCLAT